LNLLRESEESAERDRWRGNPWVGVQEEEIMQNGKLEEEEIKKAVLKIKFRKAIRIDDIPMVWLEVWKCSLKKKN